MPNRIIRQGINDSGRIDQLGWPAEVFYRRLLLVIDDHGLFDGRVSRLRAGLYSECLNRVREADISRWLAMCEKAGLIVLYETAGKPYLWVRDTRWITRSEPKFPKPTNEQLRASENNCAQLRPLSLSLSKTETDPLLSGKPDGFARFWESLPSRSKERSSRKEALSIWEKQKLEARIDEILASLQAWKRSEKWTKQDGQFIEGAHKWLKGEKYDQSPTLANGNGRRPIGGSAATAHVDS